MTKTFSTTYPNGHTVETNSAHEAHNFGNYGGGQTFRIRGVSVSATEFFTAAATAVQVAWDKKSETHKRVSVQHGASQFGRVEKWVRRTSSN